MTITVQENIHIKLYAKDVSQGKIQSGTLSTGYSLSLQALQDAAASLTFGQSQCPSTSAAGTVTRMTVYIFNAMAVVFMVDMLLFQLALTWLSSVIGFIVSDTLLMCGKAMLNAASLVLQRWKEADSLPAGMVFDAEHLGQRCFGHWLME